MQRKFLTALLAILLTSGVALADSTVHGISTSATSPLPASSCFYVDQSSTTDAKLCSGYLAALGSVAYLASPPAIGGTAPAAGAFTTLSATGQITSTLAIGTAPFVVTSTTNIPNLNASSLSGATFAAPGSIGSGTAAAGAFTTLTASGIATFSSEAHNATDTVTLTSNNYAAVVGDCGHTKLLPTGTTPTVTLPNINPASGNCTIKFITTAAISYQFVAASGGSTINSQAFSHTRGTNAGDTINIDLVTPSASAAKWNISGDLTS